MQRVPLPLLPLGLIVACGAEPATQPAQDAALIPDASVAVSTDAAVPEPLQELEDSGSEAPVVEQDASTPQDRVDGGPPVPADDGIPEGGGIVVKMVAPSICKSTSGGSRLFSCSLEPRTHSLTAPSETGRYRTRITFKRLGDCATQFPFIARFSADKLDAVKVQFLVNEEDFLRTSDDSPIESLLIENGSAYAGKEAYDASCRAWFVVEPNLVFGE
jgi:hypothetical protein